VIDGSGVGGTVEVAVGSGVAVAVGVAVCVAVAVREAVGAGVFVENGVTVSVGGTEDWQLLKDTMSRMLNNRTVGFGNINLSFFV